MRMDIVWIRRLLLLFMYLFLFLRLVLSSTRSFQWLLLLVVLLPVSVVSRARRPWETPLASLTAFSELQQQQKKTDEAADSNSFILACLIEGAHARTLANRQVSVKKEMNGKRPREQETERDKY